MGKNYFEVIYEEILKNEKMKKLKTEKTSETSFKIVKEDLTYEILYNEKEKKVSLKAISNETKEEKSDFLLESQTFF